MLQVRGDRAAGSVWEKVTAVYFFAKRATENEGKPVDQVGKIVQVRRISEDGELLENHQPWKSETWVIAKGDKKGQVVAHKVTPVPTDSDYSKLQDNEIALSEHGLSPHFVGRAGTFMAKVVRPFLQQYGLMDSEGQMIESAPDAKELPVGDKTLHLFKRIRVKGHRVWAVPESDKSILAEACRLTQRQPISFLNPAQEIALGGSGLLLHFVGQPSSVIAKVVRPFLQTHGLVDVDGKMIESAPDTKELPVGDKTLHLFKRKSGSRRIWAIPESDRDILAEACRLTPRQLIPRQLIPSFNPDREIALSHRGVLPHFVGNSKTVVLEVIRPFLRECGLQDADGQMIESAPDTKEIPVGDNTLHLFKRKSGNRRIWAVPESDKDILAEAIQSYLWRDWPTA